MSHRIKRFAEVAIFASFYLFAAVEPILGLGGHHVDTKLGTKLPRQRQVKVYQTESKFWCPFALTHTRNRVGRGTRLLIFAHSTPEGNSKPEFCSTCRIKAEGLTPNDPQMSKMLRNDGLVFPNSIRLMKARS